MDENTIKVLEQQFHNSPYHIIMETVSGLRGVAGHLIKVTNDFKIFNLNSFIETNGD